MDIEELHAVKSRERSSGDLQELRDSFYADVAAFIEDLRAERDRLAAERDDPYDDAVIRVNDKIQTAERVVEAIYERRVGKVVKEASFAANGMGGGDGALTAEERALFEDIVDRIESNKTRVLEDVVGGGGAADDVAGETSATAGTDPGAGSSQDPNPDPEPGSESGSTSGPAPGRGQGQSQRETAEEGVDAADLMADGLTDGGGTEAATGHGNSPDPGRTTDDGAGTEAADDPAGEPATEHAPAAVAGDAGADPAVDRETVRVTRDVGEIFGVDDTVYDLKAGDLVTLPAANAAPLVERDAAERLE